MRAFITVLALSTLTACQMNSAKETETEKKDSMANTTGTNPATPSANSLTDAQKSEGWQLLFDGNSTQGWHVYNKKSDGSAWKVADGALNLDTSAKKDGKLPVRFDIVSNEEYENFHLKLEL